MNETAPSNEEIQKDPDDRTAWPPEVFLANLLHELRTPVMIIKGYTKLLSAEKTTGHYPKALESISKAVERLEKVCQDVADYRSRLENKPDP